MKATGVFGITLLPGGEKDGSDDDKGSANGNVVVILSSDLTEVDAARRRLMKDMATCCFIY